MMSNRDREAFFRMALSRMQLAVDEITRIRAEIYDCGSLLEAERHLHEAISHFMIGRDAAAGEFGFQPHESMPT